MKACKVVNHCVKETTWLDIGLLKLCLCALGVIIGVSLPKEQKKTALAGGCALFSLSFCPLIVRYSRRAFSAGKK